MEETYRFSHLELTPSVFKDLLIQLFDGKQFKRQDAIAQILNYHRNNGGIVDESKKIFSVFKKATQLLQNNGIQNLGYGIWKLNFEIQDTEVVTTKTEKSVAIKADKEIGVGPFSVYLYYYDSYKELAELKGLDTWPCKIGRTDVDPLQRILGQAGTCYPELPHVALVFYCEDSAALETAIHSILKYKQKHILASPGKEWFLTSPNEIESIFETLQ